MKRLYTACYAAALALIAVAAFYVLDPLAQAVHAVKHVMHSTLKVAVLGITRTLAGPAPLPRAGAVPPMPETHRLRSKAQAERRRPLISPRWRCVPST